MVSIDIINEWLRYEPATGKFFWKKVKTRGKAVLHAEAGGFNMKGYRMISIAGRRHMTHRLVWMIETGEWPTQEIDHINGIKDDNRFCNLRTVPHKINMRNLSAHRDNKSGVLGVSFVPRRNKWVAQICIDGTRKTKYCDSLEEARYHRKKFESDLGFMSR